MNFLLGERLRQLREENKLSQKELAKYLGVTGRTISYYEYGKRFPSPETLNRIADYFNVSLDWLFGRTNIRTPIAKVAEKNSNREYNDPYSNNHEYYISEKELLEFLQQKKKG